MGEAKEAEVEEGLMNWQLWPQQTPGVSQLTGSVCICTASKLM